MKREERNGGKQIKFILFSFSTNEHVTCHMMAAQAAKCKAVTVQGNQSKQRR